MLVASEHVKFRLMIWAFFFFFFSGTWGLLRLQFIVMPQPPLNSQDIFTQIHNHQEKVRLNQESHWSLVIFLYSFKSFWFSHYSLPVKLAPDSTHSENTNVIPSSRNTSATPSSTRADIFYWITSLTDTGGTKSSAAEHLSQDHSTKYSTSPPRRLF